ncbi:60S acidic ribosomal protein P1 [Homalodisca vitripennis]|nr:60S acidic ribosomal protein P1 [Homalodisca vitripennis]
MSTKAELACVYSALILIDDDVAVTGEKIQTILKAAGVEVEPYWPGLFAKALEGINPKELITNVGAGVGAGVPASAGGGRGHTDSWAPVARGCLLRSYLVKVIVWLAVTATVITPNYILNATNHFTRLWYITTLT